MHFCVCVQTATSELGKEWVTDSSFPQIKKLGKHCTNQVCHYFRLNTGTVSTKTITQAGRCSLCESILTLNGKLLPLCIQRAPESFQTIISGSSHVKSTCGTVNFLSCESGTERTVCPLIHVHKQRVIIETNNWSDFKTQNLVWI